MLDKQFVTIRLTNFQLLTSELITWSNVSLIAQVANSVKKKQPSNFVPGTKKIFQKYTLIG